MVSDLDVATWWNITHSDSIRIFDRLTDLIGISRICWFNLRILSIVFLNDDLEQEIKEAITA